MKTRFPVFFETATQTTFYKASDDSYWLIGREGEYQKATRPEGMLTIVDNILMEDRLLLLTNTALIIEQKEIRRY